jgi:transposase
MPVVRDFFEQNPRVHFHFTLTYSSRLNRVEIWFAKIRRRHGISRSFQTGSAGHAPIRRRCISSMHTRKIRMKGKCKCSLLVFALSFPWLGYAP